MTTPQTYAPTFPQALKQAQSLISARADVVLAERAQVASPSLLAAMRYALNGGKALRAFFVLESARLHGVPEQAAALAALSVEALHAYSLIHDDLPCMDDDDLRRGKPTVHKKWDEHTAVLAGDALQALCFELLTDTEIGAPGPALTLVQRMAKSVGQDGMVGGQMMDIAAETSDLPFTLEQITAVQRRKTGALIEWSTTAGAVLANADTQALMRYGQCIGLAFQIADDILDVEGDAATVGKAVGKDEGRGKATFVSLLGLDEAKRRAAQLVHDACAVLDVYGEDAECLRQAARFVISRNS